jgi:hypothetical protein
MLKDHRISWPLFLAVLFSTVTLLVTDYAWRMMQAPVATLAVIGLAVLVGGNLAIFLAGRRA